MENHFEHIDLKSSIESRLRTLQTIMPNMNLRKLDHDLNIERIGNGQYDGSSDNLRKSSYGFLSPILPANGNVNYGNGDYFKSRDVYMNNGEKNGDVEAKLLYPGIFVVSNNKRNVMPEPLYGRHCSVIKRPKQNEEKQNEYFSVIVKKEPPDKKKQQIVNVEKNEAIIINQNGDSNDKQQQNQQERESVIASPKDFDEAENADESEEEEFYNDEDEDDKKEEEESPNQEKVPRKRAKRIYIYNPKPIVKRPTAFNEDKKKDDAYWRHRHYNNAAARRSRANRRAKEMEIMNQASVLNEENKYLTARVKELESKNDYLKTLLIKQGYVNVSDL